MQSLPALFIKTLSLLLVLKKSATPVRMDSNEPNSISIRAISPVPSLEARIFSMTSLPFFISRACMYTSAPVAWRAATVSMPIPEDAPVTSITLPVSLLTRPSSWMTWSAVGRESPAPLGDRWASAYGFVGQDICKVTIVMVINKTLTTKDGT
jgi:hypothetical protein